MLVYLYHSQAGQLAKLIKINALDTKTALEGGKRGNLENRVLDMPGPCEHEAWLPYHDVAGSEAERSASSAGGRDDQYILLKLIRRRIGWIRI